jgi:hypothetical protein
VPSEITREKPHDDPANPVQPERKIVWNGVDETYLALVTRRQEGQQLGDFFDCRANS